MRPVLSNPAATTEPTPKLTFNVAGGQVKSGFGRQDKPGARTQHLGGADASYDSYGKLGTPITNFGSGKVKAVGSAKDGGRQGNYVDVDYGNGVVVRTYHMDKVGVKLGQAVGASDVLGTMGQSGYSPSGSHASYKFFKGDKVVPANVAFPDVEFPEAQWGKQGGGSWGTATSFDPKTTTFSNGNETVGAPHPALAASRSESFGAGISNTAGGLTGQQLDMGALTGPRAVSNPGLASPVTTNIGSPSPSLTLESLSDKSVGGND